MVLRGLYGIADADASAGDPGRIGAALLDGGCRVLQLRCKGWDPEDTIRVGRELRRLCDAVGARLIANDDPAMAVAIHADGVHLGQTDGSVALARIVMGFGLVGRSTNTLDQLAEALDEGADYVAFGPMFPTPNLSRPKEVQGITRLAEARRLVPPHIPLVAIGGIHAGNLALVREAGADAWAVIGAVAGAADPVAATRALLGDERP
jgi:thiamine-phosphate diphosphorylase